MAHITAYLSGCWQHLVKREDNKEERDCRATDSSKLLTSSAKVFGQECGRNANAMHRHFDVYSSFVIYFFQWISIIFVC